MKHATISRLLIITLIIFANLSNSHAKNGTITSVDSVHPDNPDTLAAFKYTILNLHTVGSGFRDGGKVYMSPLHWNCTDWLKVLALGGAAVAIHQVDVPLNDVMYHNSTPFIKGFSKTMAPFGNVLYILPALGGTYIYARLSNKDDLSGFTITAGKAVIIANAMATWSKVLAHRHRPYDDTPSKPNQWDGPRADLKNDSFFSSHTATAFSLATVIASTYSEHKWVPPVAYSMASLIGVSRITGNDHWATDVFVGAVIGYGVGKLIYKLNRSKKIKLVITM